MILPILYKLAKTGKVTSWFISTDGSTVITETGYVDGAKTHHTYEAEPKNLGKSNATTASEQAELEAQAKWDKQLKSKYVTDPSGETTQRLPQKVGVYQDLFKSDRTLAKLKLPCYVEDKLNGVNGLFRLADNLTLMSRGGEFFPMPQHLVDPVTAVLTQFDLSSINVELYIHGEHLQDIQSCVTKPNPLTSRIEARIFQLPDANVPYSEVVLTKQLINDFIADSGLSHIECVIPVLANSHAEIDELHADAVARGCEGVIVSNTDVVYKYNERNSNVWKYKLAADAEFLIVGYELDKKGNPTLVCESFGGDFKVRPKGDQASRDAMLADIDSYIGQWYKVEYETLTKSGKPAKPIGIGLRKCNEQGEPLE